MKKLLLSVATILLVGIAAVAAFIYGGFFEIAADVPHSALVLHLIETARDRAIAVRAGDIKVPSFDRKAVIRAGARDYRDMCVGCHLAPGHKDSEMREGLYPQPPDLTQHIHASDAEMFWIIKHGIKMSAMPAWGPTHSDVRIWTLVAFVRTLPDLSPSQYEAFVQQSGESHHHDHGDHEGGDAGVPPEQ